MKTETDEPLESVFAGVSVLPSPSAPQFVSSLPADTHTLRPMTAKMLTDGFNAAPDEWRITVDGQPVSSVRMIGRKTGSKWSEDALTFNLSDGTGSVDVIYWFEDCMDYSLLGQISDGDYVMVTGRPTCRDNRMRIKAYVVRAITNYNDITHHFLMCIYTHLDTLKTNANKEKELAAAGASSSTVRTHPRISPAVVDGYGSTAEKILGILSDPAYRDIEHGVSFNLLSRIIGVDTKEISGAIELMLDMGTVFNTVSDHHVNIIRVIRPDTCHPWSGKTR